VVADALHFEFGCKKWFADALRFESGYKKLVTPSVLNLETMSGVDGSEASVMEKALASPEEVRHNLLSFKNFSAVPPAITARDLAQRPATPQFHV